MQENKESHKHDEKKDKRNIIQQIYEDKYKLLLLIPMIILLLSFVQLGYQYSTTGSVISKGVSLKGGITITIPLVDSDFSGLHNHLQEKFPSNDIEIQSTGSDDRAPGLIIIADIESNEEINLFISEVVSSLSLSKDQYSSSITGASLGESFYNETVKAVALAFIFMAIVIFIIFRVPIPSAAVVLAAFSNLITTMALVNITGIKISTAGIAAFLMLIGYSVDTDVLLSTRVLRRQAGTSVMQAVYSSLKTGVFMTITAMVAVIIGIIFSKSEILVEIFTIILYGLLCDLLYTWVQNVSIIRWYVEAKKK